MILKTILLLSSCIVGSQCCILLLNGWQPLGIEKRAQLAEVVVSARTLSKNKISGHKVLYAASFEVLSILKGWSTLDRLRRRKSRAIHSNDRFVITASGFGDRRFCFSSVDVGETYILFLAYKNVSDSLLAKYDDIFGAAELLYERLEDDILLSLGWRPWTAWTDCTQKCGRGLRLRYRQCVEKDICTGPSEEMRECNMFPCRDTYNILTYTKNFHQQSGINNAVINNAHDAVDDTRIPSVPTYLVFPDKFPPSFAIFMTIKGSSFENSEYVFTSYDANNRMQFGVRLEKGQLSFVYTNPKDMFGEKVSKSFRAALKESVWHEIAISLDETVVKIVVNCNKVGEARIEWPVTENFDIFGFLYIGADKSEGKASKFTNDITQLLISTDAEMLWKQCGTRTFFYPGYLGKSRQQAPTSTVSLASSFGGDDSESGDVDENLIITSSGGEPAGETEGSGTVTRLCSPECKNGGICKDGVCACTTGWTGLDCTLSQKCLHRCLNGGICLNGLCHCQPGWTGEDCSTAMCRQPCLHNGVCTKPDLCRCKNGTSGRYCEKFTCNPECKNGGKCIGPNICRCPSQVKGKYCEKDTCMSTQCINGGKCVFGKCICPSSFYGISCEKRVCKIYGTRKVPYLKPVLVAVVKTFNYQCGVLMLRTCSVTRMVYKQRNQVAYKEQYYCIQ